ncbi:MAG: M23 family metallopeptidase [Phenylobacterium sp.]
MLTALDGRARHWLVDAAMGACVALGAIGMAHAALPDRAPRIAPQAPTGAVHAAIVQAAATVAPAVLIAFQDPVPGREIVSPFGLRQLPWEEGGRLHAGVDIAAPLGLPVLLSADGVVTRAGKSATYGRFVEVKHAEGLTSLYAHMGGVASGIAAGTALKAGAPVGRIGSSGTSTGPHLHFEIRDARDRPLNPSLFLGRQFAEAEDLPLRAAQRVSRRVRVAYVSHIPASKRALMQAKLEGRGAPGALSAADAGRDAGVTVSYKTGRPRATIRLAPRRTPTDVPELIAPPARAPAADEAISTTNS